MQHSMTATPRTADPHHEYPFIKAAASAATTPHATWWRQSPVGLAQARQYHRQISPRVAAYLSV